MPVLAPCCLRAAPYAAGPELGRSHCRFVYYTAHPLYPIFTKAICSVRARTSVSEARRRPNHIYIYIYAACAQGLAFEGELPAGVHVTTKCALGRRDVSEVYDFLLESLTESLAVM